MPKSNRAELRALLQRFEDYFLRDSDKAQLEDLVFMTEKRRELRSLSEQYEEMETERQITLDKIELIKDIETIIWKTTQLANLEVALDLCADRCDYLKDEIKQKIRETRNPELRKQRKKELKDIMDEFESE